MSERWSEGECEREAGDRVEADKAKKKKGWKSVTRVNERENDAEAQHQLDNQSNSNNAADQQQPQGNERRRHTNTRMHACMKAGKRRETRAATAAADMIRNSVSRGADLLFLRRNGRKEEGRREKERKRERER